MQQQERATARRIGEREQRLRAIERLARARPSRSASDACALASSAPRRSAGSPLFAASLPSSCLQATQRFDARIHQHAGAGAHQLVLEARARRPLAARRAPRRRALASPIRSMVSGWVRRYG